jgi:hypothetical protein
LASQIQQSSNLRDLEDTLKPTRSVAKFSAEDAASPHAQRYRQVSSTSVELRAKIWRKVVP